MLLGENLVGLHFEPTVEKPDWFQHKAGFETKVSDGQEKPHWNSVSSFLALET